LKPIHAAVDIVVDFTDQFVQMEVENARLSEVAKSSTEQLEKANRLAAEAQKEAVSSNEELKLLKKKMKQEEQLKLETQAQAYKKEGVLCKSIESLLGKFLCLFYLSFPSDDLSL
jgi:D-aminopeptidase